MIRPGRGATPWVLILVLLPAGCGGGDAESADQGQVQVLPLEESPGPEQDLARYVGVLTVEGRPEVLLCDRTPLEADGPALMELLELHAELTPGQEPMEGLFVDVLGRIREDARGRWLDLVEVRRAAWEGWGCRTDESGVVFRAAGTEPFWTLTVREETAEWRTPDEVKQFVHAGAYGMPRGGWELDASESGGAAALRAEFHQEPCRDAMSGAYSHLSAVVFTGERELRGCAYIGPEATGPV